MVDSFSYDITVNATDTVKFVREPVLPRYLIKNCMYSFDSGEAYSFAPSTSVVPTKIYARTTGTNRTEIQNNKYAVREDVDCIDLIYTAGNMEKIYTVPVVDAGYGEIGRLKIGEYLQGEAFTYQSTRYGTTYTTDEKKATNGKATLSLINPAYLIRDFQIAFTGVTDKNNFDSITITFTSLKNSSDLIRFTFEKQANLKSIVTVSRGNYIVSSNSESTFNSNEQTGFSIVYANGNFSIGGSNLSIPYATLFDGFGDFFYIDIELAGITGESALYVKKLVNQVISSTTYDTIKPTLIYDNFNTSYVLGDTVHFSKISCYDFVDPNASVSLSVLLNYSSPVTANNGVVLDGISNSTECEYDYTWNTYSDLYVKIEAKDYSEQVATDEPVFVLLDAISPTITLGEMQTQCTLNDTVTVATPTVSDDREGVKTSIVVICPNGRTYTVKNETFIADCWGTYTVMYMATDASGNVEFASYKVICG